MTSKTRTPNLPVGTRVRVTPAHVEGLNDRAPYFGKVSGYDLFRSKYRIACQTTHSRYDDAGLWWAFPGEVEASQDCISCDGSGSCSGCRGGSINEPGLSCPWCGATHRCVWCDGSGIEPAEVAGVER